MNENRIYISGGINWNWYLGGTFDDIEKTCTVTLHDRWHKFEYRGSDAPEVTHKGSYRFMEDKDRTAYGVEIETWQDGKQTRTEYLVLNPMHVHKY